MQKFFTDDYDKTIKDNTIDSKTLEKTNDKKKLQSCIDNLEALKKTIDSEKSNVFYKKDIGNYDKKPDELISSYNDRITAIEKAEAEAKAKKEAEAKKKAEEKAKQEKKKQTESSNTNNTDNSYSDNTNSYSDSGNSYDNGDNNYSSNDSNYSSGNNYNYDSGNSSDSDSGYYWKQTYTNEKEKNHILIQLEKLGMTKVILGIIKIYGIDIIQISSLAMFIIITIHNKFNFLSVG